MDADEAKADFRYVMDTLSPERTILSHGQYRDTHWIVAGGALRWPDPFPVALSSWVRAGRQHPLRLQSSAHPLPFEEIDRARCFSQQYRRVAESPWYGVEVIFNRAFRTTEADRMLITAKELAKFVQRAADDYRMRLDITVDPVTLPDRPRRVGSRFTHLEH